MSDTDQLNPSAELEELRASFSGVPLPERPKLETITARGRMHRRRRLSSVSGLAVAGVAGGCALALGLSGALSPAPRLGTIRTAAFTLRHHRNGTDTLTLNPNELFNPAQLQNDLSRYQIPAKVTTGSFCSSNPAPSGFSQVVSNQPSGEATVNAATSDQQPTITIDPSSMPAGTELSVGEFQLTSGEFAGEQQANLALVDASSYTCTSTPPSLNGYPANGDGIGVLMGAQSGS